MPEIGLYVPNSRLTDTDFTKPVSPYYNLTGSKASAKYWIHPTGQFGGVRAFDYNSAESEPIWMKSGAL